MFRIPGRFVFLCMFTLAVGCGPRLIPKRPLPREQVLLSIRLMGEGDVLLRQGKDHLAMLKYLEASRLNPYEEVIFNKLATVYLRLGMVLQADEAIDRSLRLNPEYAYGYNTRGIVRLAFQDFKGAAKSFQRAIRLRDDVAGFYINLGFCLVQLGNVEEAVAAYRKGLSLNPSILQTASEVPLGLSPEEDLPANKCYELATIFARLGNVEYTLRFLDRALIAGYVTEEEILDEPVFRELAEESEEFRRFLAFRGVSLCL
jgi:tetratricopeptide (TPR) repeat protein